LAGHTQEQEGERVKSPPELEEVGCQDTEEMVTKSEPEPEVEKL
jgi:hypothetical protein|tara:strand:- start:296 stop:427 length:132 start_codon:yes stop_codon:yes gene_type:complete